MNYLSPHPVQPLLLTQHSTLWTAIHGFPSIVSKDWVVSADGKALSNRSCLLRPLGCRRVREEPFLSSVGYLPSPITAIRDENFKGLYLFRGTEAVDVHDVCYCRCSVDFESIFWSDGLCSPASYFEKTMNCGSNTDFLTILPLLQSNDKRFSRH